MLALLTLALAQDPNRPPGGLDPSASPPPNAPAPDGSRPSSNAPAPDGSQPAPPNSPGPTPSPGPGPSSDPSSNMQGAPNGTIAPLDPNGPSSPAPVSNGIQNPTDPSAAAPNNPPEFANRRPMLYRMEDPDARIQGPPDLKALQGKTTSSYTLFDDGTASDAKANDHIWSAFAFYDPNQPLHLVLTDHSGHPLYEGDATLDWSDQPMEIVFKITEKGVELESKAEPAPANGPSGPNPSAPTPDAPSVPSIIDTPQNAGAGPEEPIPLMQIFLGVLSLTTGLVGYWFWRQPQGVVPPVIGPLRTKGIEVGRCVLVVKEEKRAELVEEVGRELAQQVTVLMVGERPEGVGHLYKMAAARPSPAQVKRGVQRAGAQVVVLSGYQCLEAPLDDEGPTTVMEEFLKLYRGPVVVVLTEQEAAPKGLSVHEIGA